MNIQPFSVDTKELKEHEYKIYKKNQNLSKFLQFSVILEEMFGNIQHFEIF